MPSARHILIVNGRKVQQPVFIIGAPHSGTHLLAGALKRSDGVHLTIGQSSVLRVIYAFARRPSIHDGRGEAAASVLRDAFGQGWRITQTVRRSTMACRSLLAASAAASAEILHCGPIAPAPRYRSPRNRPTGQSRRPKAPAMNSCET